MTRRAIFSPSLVKQNLLIALGMGAAVILVGCGGGGGGSNPPGGGNPGACGSPAGSASTIVCGYIDNNGSTTGINGATVSLKNSAGQVVATARTAHNSTTNQDGYYVFNSVPASLGATVFTVDAPVGGGYFAGFLKFNGSSYDANRTANAGGPCVPAVPNISTAGDYLLPVIYLFADSVPPPPVINCPR